MTATVSDPPAIPDERPRTTRAGPPGAADPGPRRSSAPLSCLSRSSSRPAAQTTRTTIHPTAPHGVSAFPGQPGQPASRPGSGQPWRQPAPHAAAPLSRAPRHPPARAPAETTPWRRYTSAAGPAGVRRPSITRPSRTTRPTLQTSRCSYPSSSTNDWSLMNTTDTTIADQVARVLRESAGHLPAHVLAALESERAELNARGVPGSVLKAGALMPDG